MDANNAFHMRILFSCVSCTLHRFVPAGIKSSSREVTARSEHDNRDRPVLLAPRLVVYSVLAGRENMFSILVCRMLLIISHHNEAGLFTQVEVV